jgi:hypothetical protein
VSLPTAPPEQTHLAPSDQGPVSRIIASDDTRRMAPVYLGVIVVEILVLLAIWWFQQHFG